MAGASAAFAGRTVNCAMRPVLAVAGIRGRDREPAAVTACEQPALAAVEVRRYRSLGDTEARGDLSRAGSRMTSQVFEDGLTRDPRPRDARLRRWRLTADDGPGAQQPLPLVDEGSDRRHFVLDLSDPGLDLAERA